MKAGTPEPLSQQLIRSLTNLCFGFFVLAVLIFTIIAITYQPPDPWLEPGQSISKVLSSVKNATFKSDDSVLSTGEDFALSPAQSVMLESIPIFVPIEASDEALESAKAQCDPQQREINCTDPGVLSAIVRYNQIHFPNLNYYSYQTPVKGAEENECDVTWKFRAKKEKSWRMYRDFRRFSLQLEATCNYSVADAYGWHSGKNAKPFRTRRSSPFSEKPPRTRGSGNSSSLAMNLTVTEEVDVIEDSLPSRSESFFRNNRYLFYSRGGDHCKGMNQYLWSFLCALGEAQYLNRTFVVDLSLCLSGSNNPGHSDEDGKDFRFYFDFVHLKEAASVIDEAQFLEEWRQWNMKHPRHQVSLTEVSDFKTTPMQLRNELSTIIHRKFEAPEPDNYWYRVCEGETEKVVQRPWHLIWKSKRIMDIVNAICGQMEWDFDAIHVVRGEKAKNKELWPNLETDTSVEALIEKLEGKLDRQRYIYIATNEMEPGYFDGLMKLYTNAYTLDHFSSLWGEDSLWYNETKLLNGGKPVDFDGYMRVEVDTEVLYRAKKKIETFGDLTNDCKNGANSC